MQTIHNSLKHRKDVGELLVGQRDGFFNLRVAERVNMAFVLAVPKPVSVKSATR
jgi:hypothetical protein